MKSYRMLAAFAVVAIALASARFWPRRTAAARAATPAECLDNYYESLKSGDFDKYLRCLGEPYRTDAGRRFFDAACRDVKDTKGIVQREGAAGRGATMTVDVEEVRSAGVRRLRYHLRQDGDSWVITALDPPRETTSPIRYGTPVSGEGP